MMDQLPPGPRMPVPMQTLGYWSRPLSFIERAGARYGRRFTIRLLGQPPFVMLSDPDEIKEVFQAPPEVLHPGEGARMLEPLVGRYSVLLLDEEGHLEQRKLLLPAFHGERVQRMAGSMRELAEAEVASLPCGEEVELHLRLQRLTLEIILRTVFGLERPKPGDTRLRRESPFRPARLDGLRELLIDVLAFAESPLSVLPKPPRVLTIRGPIARQNRRLARVDELIFELIAERRREAREGDDVLALLLGAEHEDGSPMSPQELRDELVTALLVGHETTASQLAWGFERLARERAVLGRLYDELDDPAEAYLTATVQEILRHRPVLPNASPRLTMRPVEIGGVRYPKGVALVANIHLVHHDPEIYPEPQAFRPERFLEQAPGTYTWIPFGGGRRRCVGASFAVQQMKLVLRVMLERWELHPPATRVGGTRRRFSVVSPADGCRVIWRERQQGGRPGREALGVGGVGVGVLDVGVSA